MRLDHDAAANTSAHAVLLFLNCLQAVDNLLLKHAITKPAQIRAVCLLHDVHQQRLEVVLGVLQKSCHLHNVLELEVVLVRGALVLVLEHAAVELHKEHLAQLIEEFRQSAEGTRHLALL